MEQTINELSKATSIPVNNIRAYLHISELIEEMDINNLEIYSKDTIGGITKELEKLKRDGWLNGEAILRIEKCIHDEIVTNLNLDSRRPAQYAMTTTEDIVDKIADDFGFVLGSRHAMKKDGPKTNWSRNFLIYSLLQDVHYYGNRKKKHYNEIGHFLTKLEVDNENGFSDDNVRKTYKSISSKDIFKLIKLCYQWSLETEREFLPVNIEVSEIPDSFLTILSHHAGFKLSPYLATAGKSGKPLPLSVKSYRK